jgi:ankyrin repeat protein
VADDLFAAVKRGDRDTVEKQIRSDPDLLSTRDEHGTSALLLAYYHGKAEVANAILTHQPDLDMREAATVGDAARIRELGARDAASVNAFGDDGFHPLGLAAFFKRPEAVRALLDLGADPHLATRPAGFSPLHSAVADDTGQAPKEIVRMLLDAGADPNARSATGGTPLHTAAFTGDVLMVRLLLLAGASSVVEDERGRTPLDLARERGQSEAAAMLHDAALGKKI